MRILIPGGRGFIGSHICRELEDNGINHDVIDLKNGKDICNLSPISLLKYDAVILLAADLGRDESMYAHNLKIYNWLASARNKRAHIVYASSAAVYPDNIVGMEVLQPIPPTLYGDSKLLGETIIKHTQPSYTILRLANVTGSGEGNGAVDAFKRGENKIYGTGLDVRDYVDVKKVATAFIRAAVFPDHFRNEIYNISSFQPVTTLQAFKLYGKGEPNFLAPRPYDTRYSLLHNKKALEARLI